MEDADLSSSRSTIYKILSFCFLYPDNSFFPYGKEDLTNELDASLRKTPYRKDVKKSHELFKSALEQQLVTFSLEDLQVEHTGLFIHSCGKPPCLPYEYIYRERNNRLMAESTVALKRFYRRFKLRVSREFADLPDHIAAELEFMHFLSLNESKFTANGEDQNRELCINSEMAFLEDHLRKWVPDFAVCLNQVSSSKFFAALSQFTTDFLVAETNYLKNERGTHETAKSSTTDIRGVKFDTATVTVLEAYETKHESPPKWIGTTSPARHW